VGQVSNSDLTGTTGRRSIRQTLGALPGVGPALRRLYHVFVPVRPQPPVFEQSSQYWNDRYAGGGNSGAGSYGRLAHFKAEVINKFVAAHGIRTVIEFGSGDGAQLELAHYPRYTGIDVSERAVALCRRKFNRDPNNSSIRHTRNRTAPWPIWPCLWM
jgi:hypothetical protein